jgi:hypothetical protein
LKPGPLDLKALDKPYVCVVQLRDQPNGALMQVTLRPDKVLGNLIRLGDTVEDEARCWRAGEDIFVIAVITPAKQENGAWKSEAEMLAAVCPGM